MAARRPMQRIERVVKSDPRSFPLSEALVIGNEIGRELLSNLELFWQTACKRTDRKFSILRIVVYRIQKEKRAGLLKGKSLSRSGDGGAKRDLRRPHICRDECQHLFADHSPRRLNRPHHLE